MAKNRRGVGEEDLLVEDIDGKLDLVELGPLIQSTKQFGYFCLGARKVARSLQARLAGSHGF